MDYYSGGTNESHSQTITLGILLLLSCSGGVQAQEATTRRNLVVLCEPSKPSPILDHVAKDDRLIAATRKGG